MGNGGLNLRRWIVVEGLDGSGKTTVASWIKEHYEARGERVLVQMHPSERIAGTIARRSLQNKGLHMYALSTLFYILDVLISVSRLKKWGREYDDIVFVRYVMGAAYLPRRYARAGYEVITKLLPLPKRLLLVDVTPETALHRMAMRDDKEEMFENLAALINVRDKILLLSADWTVLDNDGGETGSRERLAKILAKWD
jgi:dTMP kinase